MLRIARASLICLATLLAVPSLAFAQAVILQGGAFVPGHAPMYAPGSSGVQPIVMDSGPAGGGGVGVGLSEFLRTATGTGTPPYVGQGTGPFGTNDCNYDAPITNATGYHFLCFSANASEGGQTGALITAGSAGGAANLPLVICVNGTCVNPVTGTGGLTVGTTTIGNGSSGRVLYDNAGILGEYPVTGTAGSVVLSVSPALTGTPTAPTAAPGTSTTQLATTAFVQAAISGDCTVAGAFLVGTGSGSQCSNLAGSTAVLNGGPLIIGPAPLPTAFAAGNNIVLHTATNNNLVVNNSGVVAGPALVAINDTANTLRLLEVQTLGTVFTAGGPGGTVIIDPLTGTLNIGLAVTQTGPVSGSTAGPFSYNYFTVTDNGNTLTNPGKDPFGLLSNLSSGVRINYLAGGSGAIRVGLTVSSKAVANVTDLVGGNFTAYVPSGITSSYTYGGIGYAIIDSGGIATSLIGLESELAVVGTATVSYRAGFNANSLGPVQGSTLDAAYVVSAYNANVWSGGGAAWKKVIAISSGINSTNSAANILDPAADFFFSDTAQTIANFVNLGNITVSGNILLFPNVRMAGTGTLTLGSNQVPNPGVWLQVGNSTAVPPAPATGTVAQFVSADGQTSATRVTADGFNRFGGYFTGRNSSGTAAAPAATQSGDTLAAFLGVGYGTSYQTLGGAGIIITAAQTFTGAAGGNQIDFYVTANGSIADGRVGRIENSGGMTWPSTVAGGDPGAGGINATLLQQAGVGVATTARNINTTAPITGGGNLSADRTIACATCATTTNGGALSGTSPIAVSASGVISIGAPYSATSYTSNGVLYGQGASNIAVTAQGGANTILIANAGTPSFSASPIIGTSVTVPTAYGGSAASSTLTLVSTSGSGTTDAIIFQTASQAERMRIVTSGLVGIGTNAPQSALHINANAVQNPAAPPDQPASTLQISAADNLSSELVFDEFGGGNNLFTFRATGGTAASKTQTTSGQLLGFIRGMGYTSSNAYSAGGRAQIFFVAAENYTSTAQGAYLRFDTTPIGGAATAEAMRLQASGGLSIGTTTDPGIGSLQLNAQIFMPSITTTSAAQTGTLCWTTGTGKFTVDTTVGCLTSLEEAKDILSSLRPSDALSIVVRLDPFSFRFKRGWGDGGRYEQFGLGAHQVAGVDERLVGRDPEGTLQGVRYQELTAVLVGAIKELKADNNNLRAELKGIAK